MRTLFGPLVSTSWLADRFGDPHVVVMDASWYLPASGRDARAEYLAGHVPGALWFDLDGLSDQSSPLPHMLPAPNAFAAAIGAIGVGDQDTVIVYDGSGSNLSAARAWWTFRVFGHDRVAVLDGGLGKWKADGRPLEAGPAPGRVPTSFTARVRREWIWTLEDVQANLGRGTVQVVDARGGPRFEGTEPEPRPGLRGGHIPGSRNLPYSALVNSDGTLLDRERLRQVFQAAGVDPKRPVAASCGSGVTACAVLLALETLGGSGNVLYDGSWTEWGGRADTPVETGSPSPSVP